ncbi:MAG: D-alanine--D-alanine ligase [Clostridia bacterium]|nr:D-alanine--D-alanine ligase [Clostridia bacterium]
MNIVVLAGGASPERWVSLSSGSQIANALLERGHRVLLLDLYEGIPELPPDPASLFLRGETRYAVPTVPREKTPGGAASVPAGRPLIGPNVLRLCGLAHGVFLALHGSIGENGLLQATLECHGIPYTGSDAVGSMLAMDKDLSKRLFRQAGIPTPPWRMADAGLSASAVASRVGFPCVVKPTGCGSSVGIALVRSAEAWDEAFANAAAWGSPVMAEGYVSGRELTVGILNGKALPVVEIRPREGFYDYQNKYDGSAEELCPAPIPPVIAARATAFALRGFAALRLRGYARFDFLMDHTEGLWCLEANTLPGMTPTSLFPRAAAAAGISYGALCQAMLEASGIREGQ